MFFCDKVLLQLRSYFFFGKFAFTGVLISHTLLGQRVSLENVINVWGLPWYKLRCLVRTPDNYFALLHVLDAKNEIVEILHAEIF